MREVHGFIILLHSDDQNNSELHQWDMISSFNKRRNNLVYKHCCTFHYSLNILPNNNPKTPYISNSQTHAPNMLFPSTPFPPDKRAAFIPPNLKLAAYYFRPPSNR